MSNRGVCIAEAQRFCKVVVVARSAVVHDYVEHSSSAVPLNCSKPYTFKAAPSLKVVDLCALLLQNDALH